MSEFHVRVVRIGAVEKHPNADTLSLTLIDGGYPVVFRTDEFKEGDLAAYVPIDSVVPDTEQWAFLAGHRRIKAKKLRGIFSMGMLAKLPIPADDGWPMGFPGYTENENVQDLMGIVKYEPVMKSEITHSDNEPDPGFIPRYTDIEGLRKYSKMLQEGEDVVMLEKIHGANGRWLFHEGRLWVGSHNYIKKQPGVGDPQDIWWKAALQENLQDKLQLFPGYIFYGEVFGKVQDLDYGVKEGVTVRFFDIFSIERGRYIDYDYMCDVLKKLDLKPVPELYRGPWSDELRSHAEGKTRIHGGYHVREGFVVKPTTERFDIKVGRVILKLHGEGYLLRKES